MTTELLIVTNNHVVEDSEELTVTFIDNSRALSAAVKGTDSDTGSGSYCHTA